ncbi:MAG: ATP-dependent DNA helicase [Phycisphaerae bacterium]
MTDSEHVRKILGSGGPVAEKLPNYEVRPQQLEMAVAVAEAFAGGRHLAVEAGTGVGKSFAYLVPAIEHVLRRGGRVVVSTHTIALQEQLVEKDIPFLRGVLAHDFTAVLVKGRSNYLGLRRLARASQRQATLFESGSRLAELHRIEDWAYETTDGSLSDLERQPDAAVWDRVRSEHDDCLGRRCPTYERCFFQRARRRAGTAQLLIVNHAMLFSDLAVRSRGASILPEYDLVVLDEAHTVERVAGDHLGASVSDTQVHYLLNLLFNERTGRGVLAGHLTAQLQAAISTARTSSRDYFTRLEAWNARHGSPSGRLRAPPPVKQDVAASLVELQQRMLELRHSVKDDEDRSELAAVAERCGGLSSAIADWHAQSKPEWVYWMERKGGSPLRVTLCARPVDIGTTLKAVLFDAVKSVVLTSATLTVAKEDPFAYLRSRLRLDDVRTLQLGSPFNYREQVRVYLESAMPDPADEDAFVPAACEAIKKYVGISGGRAFVLFTSYHMLRQCAAALGPTLEQQRMPLLVQGAGLPRSRMLEMFRSTPRSVLLGTDTFWAGVDVAGDALSNVIIVKLPFASPSNPVVEADIERIRASGGNPFLQYQVPEAILKFRQGIGRLIRSRGDRGIVAILDPRVRTKPYGRRFLEALPAGAVIVPDG